MLRGRVGPELIRIPDRDSCAATGPRRFDPEYAVWPAALLAVGRFSLDRAGGWRGLDRLESRGSIGGELE